MLCTAAGLFRLAGGTAGGDCWRWVGLVRLKSENSPVFWLLTVFLGCGRLALDAARWTGGAKWMILGAGRKWRGRLQLLSPSGFGGPVGAVSGDRCFEWAIRQGPIVLAVRRGKVPRSSGMENRAFAARRFAHSPSASACQHTEGVHSCTVVVVPQFARSSWWR